MKKIISLFLAAIMIFSVPVTAFASNADAEQVVVENAEPQTQIPNAANEAALNISEAALSTVGTAFGLKSVNAFGPDTKGMNFFEALWAWILWFFNILGGREDANILSITMPSKLEVAEGEWVRFEYSIKAKNPNSSILPAIKVADESIIKLERQGSVKDGKMIVTGLKPGTTTITVTCEDLSEVCTVTVKKAEKITINISVQYGEGKTRTFSRVVEPGFIMEPDKIYSWIAEEGFDYQNNTELISISGGAFGRLESGKTYNYTCLITDKIKDNMFEYRVCAPNAVITKYIGNETDVVIPATVENYKVIGIGDSAFAESKIQSVIIPDNIEYINAGAFKGCPYLETITIGKNMVLILWDAFADCPNLKHITFNAMNCDIESRVFDNCSSELTIHCFAGSSAETYAIKNNIKYECIGLKDDMFEYRIEDTVAIITKYIGNEPDVVVPETVGNYKVIGIGEDAFAMSKIKSVVIHDNITTIGDYAFWSCDSLTSVTIGKSVTNIGDEAFYSCTSLTNVNFKGTEEQWNNIKIDSGNDCLLNAPNKKFATDMGTIVVPEYVYCSKCNSYCKDYEVITSSTLSVCTNGCLHAWEVCGKDTAAYNNLGNYTYDKTGSAWMLDDGNRYYIFTRSDLYGQVEYYLCPGHKTTYLCQNCATQNTEKSNTLIVSLRQHPLGESESYFITEMKSTEKDPSRLLTSVAGTLMHHGLSVLIDDCYIVPQLAPNTVYLVAYAEALTGKYSEENLATVTITVWNSIESRTVEIKVLEGSKLDANTVETILSTSLDTEAIVDDFGTITAVGGEKYTVTAYE